MDLAVAFIKKLSEFYKSRIDQEFRYSENIRVLLEIIVTLGKAIAIVCTYICSYKFMYVRMYL